MFEDGWGELLPPPQNLLTLPFDEEAVEEKAVVEGPSLMLELRLWRRERLGQPAWKRNCFNWERGHLCEIFDVLIQPVTDTSFSWSAV